MKTLKRIIGGVLILSPLIVAGIFSAIAGKFTIYLLGVFLGLLITALVFLGAYLIFDDENT